MIPIFAAWHIGIHIRTFTNIGGFARISEGATLADTRVKALNRSMHTLRMGVQMGMGAVSVAAGAAVLEGIKGAADLQTAMTNIQNATGATASQMDKLRQTAYDMSASTAQSVVDSANLLKVMATAGINDPEKLRRIAKPVAMFADVQFLSRGVPFEQGATQAIQMAHLFQRYTPEQVEPIFNRLTQLSQMMPDNLNRFVTQAGYYMPTFRRLGVSDDDALVAGAFLDRMGLGRGKGGTGLQNFVMQQMQALALTSHVQKHRKDALTNLGLLNPDGSTRFYKVGADGAPHFDIFGALNAINESVARRTHGLHGHALEIASAKSITDIQSALGITGGRIGLLGTPEALAQLRDMLKQLHDPRFRDMYGMQANSMNTLNGQWQLFRTNFSSLLTDIMYPWLNTLQSVFGSLASTFHDWQAFLHKNPIIEKGVGLGLGGVSIITGAIALAMTRMGLAMFTIPAQLDRVSAALLKMGTAADVAGGEIGAGETAAKAGLLGISAAIATIGAIFGGPLMLHILAAQQSADRSAAGTHATERGQYGNLNRFGGFQLYDKHGNKSNAGTYNWAGVPLDHDTLAKIHQYNPQVFAPHGGGQHVKAPGTAGAHGKTVAMTNIFNYHAPSGGDEAAHKRAALAQARVIAQQVAEVFAREGRTGIRAAGGAPQMFGMSPFEVTGQAV